jgi:hypothetical protein
MTYKEPGGPWIADGDTPFETMADLRRFYDEHLRGGALIIAESGGQDVKWGSAQKLALSYCVSTRFGDRHADVVTAMESAARAWEGAAELRFEYRSQYDESCDGTQAAVVFDVRPVHGAKYLARSFFPSTSRKNRNVMIDDGAFNHGDKPSVTGVLRHELGHTLGFRHEQTRPEAGVCFEDDDWRALTPYDSASVMQYPQCNGTGDWSLMLTDRDKEGVAGVYGPPDDEDP